MYGMRLREDVDVGHFLEKKTNAIDAEKRCSPMTDEIPHGVPVSYGKLAREAVQKDFNQKGVIEDD